jgi:glycosyltransferase involved in cell wall biosynthesis
VLVSIIVPAFNEERLLGSALESVRRAAVVFPVRGWRWELIVCDNNSTDRTAEIARLAGAAVVFEPVNQIGRARNTGARAAKGDWLCFIDADSHPTPELFEDVINTIAGGKCIAGGVTLRLDTDHRLANAVTGLWNWISRTFRLLAGSFIFCDAAAFREVGGFDEELFASEEIDLSRKLKRLGRRQGRGLAILNRHPMVTSARKVHLYSLREHFIVIGKAILTGSRSLKTREHCATWYDGRR